MDNSDAEARVLAAIRTYLLVVIGLVLFGLLVELIMLNHVSTPLQILPVGLAAGGLCLIVAHFISPNSTCLRMLKAMLLACTIVGAMGIAIHLGFYVQDRHDKALGRRGLPREVPPLAPAAMLPLGLMGLACTFKHPLMEEEYGESFHSITKRQ